MSNTFEPRSLGPGAWKGWHKDALRLMGRVGVVWLALWSLVVVGVAWQLAMATKDSGAFLGVMIGAQMLGVLTQPLLQAVLDQAARAEQVSFPQAFRQAVEEISQHKRWFLARMAGQVLGFFLVLVIFAILGVIGRSMGGEAPAQSIPDPLNPVATVVVFFAAVPFFLRKHGTLDFRYWLMVRHNMPANVASLLQALAQHRNTGSFIAATYSLMAAYLALTFSPWAVVLLVAVPLMHWYYSAVVRCAYYDLFEDGTGLADKAAVEATVPGGTPVLQA